MDQVYDLIIIGNSNQSFLTAEYATSLGAKVGLISSKQNYLSSVINSYKNIYLERNYLIKYQEFIEEQQFF